jgi:hypothetical protein
MSTETTEDIERKVDAKLGKHLTQIAYWGMFGPVKKGESSTDLTRSEQRKSNNFIDREIFFAYKLTRGEESAKDRIDLLKQQHHQLFCKIIYIESFSQEERLELLGFWSNYEIAPYLGSYLEYLKHRDSSVSHILESFEPKNGKEIEALIFLQRELLDSHLKKS